MDTREQKAIIESLLFVWGDPLSIKDISDVLEIDKKQIKEILEEMADEFNYERRGIQIIKTNNLYQLGTRPEHFDWIKKLSIPKDNRTLSNAALETLSIIAYKQPIIKNEIEIIRGVKCDKAISTLLTKNLIKESGRLDRTGRPILYTTTDEFLRCFGIESLKDLPKLKRQSDIEEETIIK